MAKKKTTRKPKPAKKLKHSMQGMKPKSVKAPAVGGGDGYTITFARVQPSAVDLRAAPDVPPYRITPLRLTIELEQLISSKVDIQAVYDALLNMGPIDAGSAVQAAQIALQKCEDSLNSERVSLADPTYNIDIGNAYYRPTSTGGHETAAWVMVHATPAAAAAPWEFDYPTVSPQYTVYVSMQITVEA